MKTRTAGSLIRCFGVLGCIGLSFFPCFVSQAETRQPTVIQMEAVSRPDSLKTGLQRDFMIEADWESLLSVMPADKLLHVVEGQSTQFWKSSPIALSAAYRIFGALGRFDAASAVDEALRIFTRKELGQDFGKLCFRWAILGITESQKEFLTQNTFTKCPPELWKELIQGIICGSDTGSIGGDMLSFRALFSQLPVVASSEEKQSQIDSLMGSVVDAWIERNPAAAMAWLMAKDGKPYSGALPRAIEAVILGNPDAAAMLMADPSTPIKIADLAAACCENGWDTDAVRSLTGKLPATKRVEFLGAYAQQLAEGSPRTLLKFLDTADSSLLIPEVTKVLGPRILSLAPALFEKLSSQMELAERNRFLDESLKQFVFSTEQGSREASTLYLKMRGAGGPQGESAVRMLARVDLQKALAFAGAAPEEKQKDLISHAYVDHFGHLAKTAPAETLFSFLQSAPLEVQQSAMERLAMEAPEKCFDALLKYYPKNAEMWTAAILGTSSQGNVFLSGDEMNDHLDRAIKSGIDPAVYSIVAKSVAIEFAKDDITEACAAVEALTDPKVQEVCTAAVINVWKNTDPMQAFTYISKMPSGGRRDSAIAELLPGLSFASAKGEELLALVSTEAGRNALRALSTASKANSK